MRIGTKSVLFGAHAFFLHPVLVFVSYWRLYGFPRDPRLIVAFMVHDLGYLGMDSVEGPGSEKHVELGGRITDFMFGRRWGDFVRCHSRSWCERHGRPYSRLCVADKLAFVLTPAWLYLPMVRASGELAEYVAATESQVGYGKFTEAERVLLRCDDAKLWLQGLKSYTRRWIEGYRNDRKNPWDVDLAVVKEI